MKGLSRIRLNLTSLLPILFCFLLFPAVWQTIASAWLAAEQDNTHAFPAFLAALYIALFTQYKLQAAPKLLSWFATLLITGLLMAYLLVQIVNIEIITFALMLGGLALLYVLFFGVQHWLKSALTLLLIFLTLPIWDGLLEPLVVIASNVVTQLVSYLNITVLIEGNSITTPYGRILIAEGCSGIRYLMVSVILSAIVSHTNHYRTPYTASALCLGVLVGLVANWVRIILLILVGYYSEMQSSLMVDHEMFGWVVFAVFIVPALYFAPHHKPKQENPTSSPVSQNRKNTRPIKLVFILAVVVNGALFALSNAFGNARLVLDKTPSEWVSVAKPNITTTLPIPKAIPLNWFRNDEATLVIGTKHNQKNSLEEKLVPYMEQSLVNDFWFLESDIDLSVKNNLFTLQVIKSFQDNRRVARVQLFNTGTNWTSSYSKSKVQQIPAILSGHNTFTYYLFLAECKTPNCAQAINLISEQVTQVINQ